MQINNLKRATKNKRRMVVGRGGKRGKTAGRGTKGQKARSGHKIRPEIRDFIKKLPRMRGRGKNSNLTIETKPIALNLAALEKVFKTGDAVNYQSLMEKKIISKLSGRIPPVKILGDGELSLKLSFSGLPVSKSAREKIEKVGGTIA